MSVGQAASAIPPASRVGSATGPSREMLRFAMHARLPTSEAPAAACRVTTHALAAAPLSEIQRVRDQPVPEGAPSLPSRFLRHCDEQTVVGMRAVLTAIAAAAEPRPSYADYAVVAGACRAGRIATARSLSMYRTGGAVTVSPHIVPQCSLHSLAGAVSVALGMHGPHVGSSGGPHAVSEGLLAAFSLAAAGGHGRDPLPGIWLVLTGWTKEPALDREGQPLASADAEEEPVCRALAMALVPIHGVDDPAATVRGPVLALHPTPPTVRHGAAPPPVATELVALDGALTRLRGTPGVDQSGAAAWSHVCPWAMELRLTVAGGLGLADPRQRPVTPLRKEAA